MFINRRQFVKGGLYSSAALLSRVALGSPVGGAFYESGAEECDCIVIGAGMAGLTAARELSFPAYTRKAPKVILLEASGRIGGRILTLDDLRMGGPVEMGAEYLHREPGTVALWKEIEKYQVRMEKVPRMLKGQIYYDGWEHDLRTHIGMAKEWNFIDIVSFAGQIDGYQGPNISAKEWLDRQNYSNLGRNLVDLYFTGHIPGHLDEISVRGFAADRISEQELEWNEYGFVDGYSSFLEQMVQGIQHHRGRQIDIRFHSPVNLIRYRPDGVEVHTRDGRHFKAKAAVITVSVGMLKSGEITFDPPLPADKEKALEYLGMGDEAKVALKFKRRFWDDEAVILNRIDNHHEMARTYFVPFASDPERNKVLAVLFAGEEADRIRQRKDSDVIQALCRDFDKMFPRFAPTYNLLERQTDGTPIYLRWQWSDDPFSKGSDSFLKAGVENEIPVEQVRKVLSLPHSTPGLFWAGEATASGEYTQPCSTHGAHFSGLRAAMEAEQHIRKLTGSVFSTSQNKKNDGTRSL